MTLKNKYMKIGNRPELYVKTVNILYDAYFNNTLEHGDCTACAVGNICIEASQQTGVPNHIWKHLFFTMDHGRRRLEWAESNGLHELRNDAVTLIAATGYEIHELSKVEYAFETARKGTSAEDYMFNGLVAVLNTLAEIHEVEEDTESFPRFDAHYSTRRQRV